MKISLKWMAELFPELSGGANTLFEKAPELRTRLPFAGLEIGSWKRTSEGIEDVVVAQIVSFEKHPQADRLNVTQISTGEGKPLLQVVCGAPNVKAGMKVALAPVGATLPGDFKIKEAKIRNVDSRGMLCSEKELGLSEESNGIMELPSSAPLGSKFVNALGLQDEVWDVELTPDRGDCLSHFGLARELQRLVGAKAAHPESDKIDPKDQSDVALISVEVQAKQGCPMYGAQLFEGIRNVDSPDWLKRRLQSIGARSHNALVDITNYVLMELGQPMHAFDADKIRGSRIIVRQAKEGEKLKTLDGVERVLSSDDLVIADLEGPIALAGVMGGFDSGVTLQTTRAVLETAVFDPDYIRATAKRHKIHSDSSHRFERGVDASNRHRAAGRASLLIRQLTGAKKRGAYIEILGPKANDGADAHVHNFDLRAFKSVTGIEAAAEEIRDALISVGIDAQVKSPNLLRVEVPPHRHDLVREIDLVEESARLLGYDRVPERYPPQRAFTKTATTPLFRRLRLLRRRLVESGLTEMKPYVFISERQRGWLGDAGRARTVELENPLSKEWQYLRPNASFGLIEVLARHAALGQMRGSFFDLGAVFADSATAELKTALQRPTRALMAEAYNPANYESGVLESWHAGFALMGERGTEHWSSDKTSSERKAHVDFFDGKGLVETLVENLQSFDGRWGGLQFLPLSEFLAKPDWAAALERDASWVPHGLLHPGRSAILSLPGKPPGQIVGYVGEIHPVHRGTILNLATGLTLGAVIGELRVVADLKAELAAAASGALKALAPDGKIQLSRKLPVVERDLALVVAADVREGELERTLRRSAGVELLDLTCIDRFVLPDGKVSLAFRAWLQGQEKTLGDEEINALLKKMQQGAAEKHQAVLR